MEYNEFIKCDTCIQKPENSLCCGGCFNNSAVIKNLKAKIPNLGDGIPVSIAKIDALESAIAGITDCYDKSEVPIELIGEILRLVGEWSRQNGKKLVYESSVSRDGRWRR